MPTGSNGTRWTGQHQHRAAAQLSQHAPAATRPRPPRPLPAIAALRRPVFKIERRAWNTKTNALVTSLASRFLTELNGKLITEELAWVWYSSKAFVTRVWNIWQVLRTAEADRWNLSELKSSASSRFLLHRKRVSSSHKPKHAAHSRGTRPCPQSLSGGTKELGEAPLNAAAPRNPDAEPPPPSRHQQCLCLLWKQPWCGASAGHGSSCTWTGEWQLRRSARH